jgi:hypothetical protein
MTAKIGYQSYIGWGEETSLGTAVQPTKYIQYNSESMVKEIAEQNIEAINGTNQFQKRVRLNEDVSGSIEYPVVPGDVLQVLNHLSGGNVTTTNPSTGVFQYEFVFKAISTLTSLTLQVARDTADTDTSYNYTGCRVSSQTFNVAIGELLNGTSEFMGVDQESANTISTASYTDLNPYTFKDGTISIGNTDADATSTCIDTFNLNIANNLLEDRCIGSATRTVIEPGMQDVTMELTARYEDNSFYNRFLNGTKTYVSALFESDSITGHTTKHSLKFEAWNCYYNGSTPNIGSASEIIKTSYPIRAIYEDASVGTLKVTVITDIATITS